MATINYFMNDPTTPDLVQQIEPPANFPCDMRFSVVGYEGGGFPWTSKQGRAAEVYYAIWTALNWLQDYKVIPNIHWAAVSNLVAYPEAGEDLNAYYDRLSLKYFYITDPVTRQVVYLCNSQDVVAHECGHAILDAHVPQLFSLASLEAGALHEAFGDFTALMCAITFSQVRAKFLAETNGNFKIDNCISKLAEQAGQALYDILRGRAGFSSSSLRDAINSFQYVDPCTLPEQASSDDQLCAEVHSFSRVFTGAFWDILAGMYAANIAVNQPPDAALTNAMSTLSTYMLTAIVHMPLTAKMYSSLGYTLLWVDAQQPNAPYGQIIKSVLINRNIITNNMCLLATAPPANAERIITKRTQKSVVLSHHFLGVQSTNPLFNVEMELPQDETHFYDHHGKYMHTVSVTDQETLDVAKHMAEHLHSTNKVGDDDSYEFKIENGKLVRRHFKCC